MSLILVMAQLYEEVDRVQCYLDLMYIGICYGFYVHMRLSVDLKDFFFLNCLIRILECWFKVIMHAAVLR